MKAAGRYDGTLSYAYAHWPTYLFVYGGGAVLALAVILVSAARGWWAFILLSLALLLVLAYFFAASIWAAHKLYDKGNVLDHDVLFHLGQLEPTDHFVHVGLGLKRTAVGLARHLTTGRLVAIDIYNPQLAPSQTLARWRRQTRHPQPDPRLHWRDGALDMLPLPDNSIPAVTMSQTAIEFWQHGDRLCLFSEIFRILAPGGRFLLCERVRSHTNLLVMGPAALRLPTTSYWRNLLEEAGFFLQKEQDLYGLAHCVRADKPLPYQGRQLSLDIRF